MVTPTSCSTPAARAEHDDQPGLRRSGHRLLSVRARRYYRALEFTATKRFTNNYQFIASYVYSSLIGNYEGLFRNDNGQSDPNITSLFDLVSLLERSLRTSAE